MRPDYPLASFALRRQKQSAARVLSSGFRRRTEPPDCQKRWRPTFMTARRFRLRGTVFLPGRRIPLREPKSLPLGSPWTFDSSRLGVCPLKERDSPRGERPRLATAAVPTRTKSCPSSTRTTSIRRFPRRRARSGPGCARDPAARARGGTRTPRSCYPPGPFPPPNAQVFCGTWVS